MNKMPAVFWIGLIVFGVGLTVYGVLMMLGLTS